VMVTPSKDAHEQSIVGTSESAAVTVQSFDEQEESIDNTEESVHRPLLSCGYRSCRAPVCEWPYSVVSSSATSIGHEEERRSQNVYQRYLSLFLFFTGSCASNGRDNDLECDELAREALSFWKETASEEQINATDAVYFATTERPFAAWAQRNSRRTENTSAPISPVTPTAAREEILPRFPWIMTPRRSSNETPILSPTPPA
ncbi:hypothetical protein PFISCL1PPCAC_16919, partial [Pristionchus fissidentatus]